MSARPFTKYNFFYAATAVSLKDKDIKDTEKYRELRNKLSRELNKLIREYGKTEVDTALIELIVGRVKELTKEVRAGLFETVITNLALENNDIIKQEIIKIPMPPKPDDKEVT